MIAKQRQRFWAGAWAGVATLLLSAGVPSAWGQSTSPLTVTGTANSRIQMINTNSTPDHTWTLFGNENVFDIQDGGTNPFSINKGAPTGSQLIDSTGRILFAPGISALSPARSLHVIAPDMPALRLEQSTFGGNPAQAFDLEASELGFNIIDVTNANHIPFTILPGAPTNSLFVAVNGSVGLGTSQPTFIGTTNAGGQAINVKATSGPARFVVQGAVGGELNLVHNNAPANQRNLRIRSEAGVTNFHVVNDALTGFTVPSAIAIKMSNGNIGLRVANPTSPLQLASGALCSAGGVWTDASSRELKQDIEPITSEQARDAVKRLQPVGYRYKNELDEHYVGFIAEDVPDLVATRDRKSLAPMDITAVLTKVVQDQGRLLDSQERMLDEERQRNDQQQQLLAQQQETLTALTKRLTELEQKSAK